MPPHDLPDEPHRQPIDSFIIGSTDFLYFVVGVAATGYASAALARWCVANWQIGSELLVFLVLVAAFVIPVASLLAVKRGRRAFPDRRALDLPISPRFSVACPVARLTASRIHRNHSRNDLSALIQ